MFAEATLQTHVEREPGGSTSTGPSIIFPIPLFDTGQAASAKVMSMIRASQRRYVALAIDIRSQVRASYAKMQIAGNKAQYLLRDDIPLQDKIIAQNQKLYN